MQWLVRLGSVAVLSGILGNALPAAAQEHPCPGQISATALRPLPPDASFNLAGRVDSDAERQLKAAVLAALQRSGRPVSDTPTHLLSWRGGIGVDSALPGRPSPFDELSSFHDSDDLHWMQDVPRLRRAPASAMRRRLNGIVELRERASGRVVWTAMLSCERHGSDQNALFGTLIGAVLPVLGQSVSARQF